MRWLLLAVLAIGARCGDPLDAVLLVPPQPTPDVVELVLAATSEPHPTVEGAVRVPNGRVWQELGEVTAVRCVRVNRLVAQRSGYLCRPRDGACVRVTTVQGPWTAEDCP